MGEKYDDCGDYDPPRIHLRYQARLLDPSGPGFPPESYPVMRAWGAEGQRALGDYLGRPQAVVESVARDVGRSVESAGSDPARLLAAGNETVERLDTCERTIAKQGAQGDMALQMVLTDGAPPDEVAKVALGAARGLKQAASALDPVSGLFASAVGRLEDAALNTVQTKVEAGCNRITQLASAQMARYHDQMFRRGMLDPPGAPA